MDRIKKFLGTLDRKRRMRIEQAIAQILANTLHGLDIKPLKGQKNAFRCRIGDVRILFLRVGGQNVVYDVTFRGDAYKK